MNIFEYSTSIIEKLRFVEKNYKNRLIGCSDVDLYKMAKGAADEIERLQAKLAEYEQLGEVEKVQGFIDNINAIMSYGFTPAEIVELVSDKLDGRLIRLPCKVGDTVYGAINKAHTKINALSGNVFEFPFKISMFDDIGKLYFLTREEAEEALRGD